VEPVPEPGMTGMERIGAAYRRDTAEDRPLGAYTALLATWGATVAGAGVLARRRLPGRLAPADLLTAAVATHTASRLLARDPVTSPLRAPFTRYRGTSGPAQLDEEARGTGLRHALGELMTCPYCLAPWLATGFLAGLATAPRATRTLWSLLTVVGVADALQLAWDRAAG
jgi:hypothetical protein